MSSHFHCIHQLHQLIPLIRCCVASLLGWVFSFTWDVIFKLFFTLFLASFPLSVWFECEYRYRRQFDELFERVEALQHHIAVILTTLRVHAGNLRIHAQSQSLQLNPSVSAVGAGLPITTRAIPADLGQSSMEGIVQPVIPEGNNDDGSKESIIDFNKTDLDKNEHLAKRHSPDVEPPIPTPFQHSPQDSSTPPRPPDTSHPRRFSAIWAGDHPRLQG